MRPELPPETHYRPPDGEIPYPLEKGEIEKIVEEGETLLEFYAGLVVGLESSQVYSNLVDDKGTLYMITFSLDLYEQATTNANFLMAKIIKDGSESIRIKPRPYELTEEEEEYFQKIEKMLDSAEKESS